MGDGDLQLIAREQEALGLHKNKVLLSHLSAFQSLLDDYYGSSHPSSDDYANRRDLIRIFNEIAKEIYGNDDRCPVVEIFGSFLMDMFNAKSDLDLSINFSDKLFEADRVVKIKTLRKFAKKFYALRKKGHVTTVELILSARVPVLKVTDSGSGIECDFSVGNRDGIAKSHIVLLISAIDDRLQKLSYMLKAWAKAHDINSSKDGTLNSLSLILLAAFHLQTRDIPILPPFFAIFRDGMDPMAVKKIIPSFLNYGKRNKESLAELFLSLLVKLESVETLWSRGLCASTYEGSWVYKNWKAAGCIRIEDFSDRSQNTARAVRAVNINKIYSCIRRSVEQIQSFTKGIISADKLKYLLFGEVPPQTKKKVANVNYSKLSKPVSQNPTSNKKKPLSQEGSAEGQRPGKQGEHCHNPSGMEIPNSSGIGRIKKNRKRKKYDAVIQRLDKSQGTLTMKGQRPPPLPIQTSGGFRPQRAGTGALNNVTHITHFDPLSHAAPHFPEGRPLFYSDPYIQGSGGFRPDITQAETLRRAALNYPPHQTISLSSSRGFRPERNHVETMKYAAPKYPQDQPLSHSNIQIQGYGGHIRERTDVEISRYALNFSAGPPVSVTNTPVQGFERYMPDRMHSETSSYSVPKSQLLPLAAGFRPERAHTETYHHTTPSSQTSHWHTLSNRRSSRELPPHQPYVPTAHFSNTVGLQRSRDTRRSLSHEPSHFAVNMRPYQY